MSNHFSEETKKQIYDQIIDVATQHFTQFGIKKTSVDEICKGVGIAKGSFYTFFKSKFELATIVIEDTEKKIKGKLYYNLKNKKGDNRTKFVSALLEAFLDVKNYPWLVHLFNNSADYNYLLRNMSAEQFKNLLNSDEVYMAMLLDYFGINHDNISIELITATLRSIFLSLLHIQEIGATQIDHVMELQLKGLANYIFGDDNNDSS